jgi:hypothetical protein
MTRLALAVTAAALLVALAAVIDHRHKREVEFAAQEDAWFCKHGRPAACRDFDEVAYEERWEQRELGYRITFAALGLSALGLGTGALRRRSTDLARG